MPRSDLLIRGAELLEADAANPTGVRFDLGSWSQRFDAATGEKEDWDTKPTEIPVSCGTSACAMGLFAISGAFKDQGLKVSYTNSYRGDGSGFMMVPHCRGYEGFAAAQELFGITEEEADRLFNPDAYNARTGAVAELQVAERMRDLAAGLDIGVPVDEDYDDDTDVDY